jgi:D-glycero-alpha-D-manno-heptose 1-phosphate guanylyltransferase
VNAGIYAWPAEWLAEISCDQHTSLEYEVLPAWCRAGRRIEVVEKDDPFIDIGTPESLAGAEAFLERLPARTSS